MKTLKSICVPMIIIVLAHLATFGFFALAALGAFDPIVALVLSIIFLVIVTPFYFGIQKHSRDWLYQGVVLAAHAVCIFAENLLVFELVKDNSALWYFIAMIILSIFVGAVLLIDVIRLVVDRVAHRKSKRA